MKIVVWLLAVGCLTFTTGAAASAAPSSCVAALNSAERMTHTLGDFTAAVSAHLDALQRAERSTHVRADVRRAIKQLGNRAGALDPTLNSAVKEYVSAAAKCRAS